MRPYLALLGLLLAACVGEPPRVTCFDDGIVPAAECCHGPARSDCSDSDRYFAAGCADFAGEQFSANGLACEGLNPVCRDPDGAGLLFPSCVHVDELP